MTTAENKTREVAPLGAETQDWESVAKRLADEKSRVDLLYAEALYLLKGMARRASQLRRALNMYRPINRLSRPPYPGQEVVWRDRNGTPWPAVVVRCDGDEVYIRLPGNSMRIVVRHWATLTHPFGDSIEDDIRWERIADAMGWQ